MRGLPFRGKKHYCLRVRVRLLRHVLANEPLPFLFTQKNTVMKQHHLLWVTGIVCVCLFACNQSPKKENNYRQETQVTQPAHTADTVRNDRVVPATPGVQGFVPRNRKFIQSGFVEFETDSTLRTTRLIEEETVRVGGFILQSHVFTTEQKTVKEPVSTDSVKQLTYYRLNNEMVVRVPDTALRGFLNRVEQYSRFTVKRDIDAQDVSVNWLSGSIEQARLNKQARRREQQMPGMNSKTQLDATDMLEAKEDGRDATLVKQVQLADDIQMSTVRLNMHQPVQLSVQYLVNEDAEWAKGPGFFTRAGYAFANGWAKCREIVLFFIGIWWLLLIVLFVWMGYRKWGKRALAK